MQNNEAVDSLKTSDSTLYANQYNSSSQLISVSSTMSHSTVNTPSSLSSSVVHDVPPSGGIGKKHRGKKIKENILPEQISKENYAKMCVSIEAKKLHDAYYGIEFDVNGKRIVFSSYEILLLMNELLKGRIQSLPYQSGLMRSTLNQLSGGYQLVGINGWLEVIRYIMQKPRNIRFLAEPIILRCGGRKIVVYNPSDRYVYDLGSYDQYSADFSNNSFINFLNRSENDVKVEIVKKSYEAEEGEIPQCVYNHYMYHQSSDAIKVESKDNDKLGYRFFLQKLIFDKQKNNLTDKRIVEMARNLLQGWEPCSYYSLNPHLALANMPSVLPVLITTLFAAEPSRNRLCFITGFMLLNLLEIGATVNGIPVNWENILKHADMHISNEHADADPSKLYRCLGGLHPMTHLGSSEEFGGDPFRLTEDFSWSHSKSAAIAIEWFIHYFNSNVDPQRRISARKLTLMEYNKWQPDPAFYIENESLYDPLNNREKMAGLMDKIFNTEPSEEDDLRILSENLDKLIDAEDAYRREKTNFYINLKQVVGEIFEFELLLNNLSNQKTDRKQQSNSSSFWNNRHVPKITRSQYKKLTGLDVVVSSNFGIVVP